MTDETPEPTTSELLATLTASIDSLHDAVAGERIGRRSNRVVGAVGIVLAVLVLGLGGKAYVDQSAITCETRTESREETRAAIAAAVDEVAAYADLTDADRERVAGRVAVRVARALPPPACSGQRVATPLAPATETTVRVTCDDLGGPIREGDDGYAPELDGDGDGVACE